MERKYDTAREILLTMQKRYSLRSFADREIPNEILKEIIKTGLAAASGGNLQPYSVLVVREPERKQRLAQICSEQSFIEEAAVDLIFLLDWHRYECYAKQKQAPFAAYRTANHFLIAMEDLTCAAQCMETAAWLCGIGSCYVGSVIGEGEALAELLQLPDKTYPMLMLSLGYPRQEQTARRPKLPYEMMVFEEAYPQMTAEQIGEAFDGKQLGRSVPLPKTEPYRGEALKTLQQALETTYSPEEAERIAGEADKTGQINETQRRFGLHYVASEMVEATPELWKDLGKQGIDPFGADESNAQTEQSDQSVGQEWR